MMRAGQVTDDALSWVDDYIANIRPHFHVREADSLLIVLPNQAVRLNRSGLAILSFLRDGGSIRDVLRMAGDDLDRHEELLWFFCDFRSLVNGCLGEGRGRRAVRVESHPKQFNVLPVLSEIAVTYRCNLKCGFCYAACGCRGRGGSDDREMSTDEIKRVLEIIRRDAQVPSVSFTGGEPLIREDLEHLVGEAVRVGLRVNLITNATMLSADRAIALRVKTRHPQHRSATTRSHWLLDGSGAMATVNSAALDQRQSQTRVD